MRPKTPSCNIYQCVYFIFLDRHASDWFQKNKTKTKAQNTNKHTVKVGAREG